MFYIKLILVLLWVPVPVTIAILTGIISWRNPYGAHIFTTLFTEGASLITGVKVHIINSHRLKEAQPCVYLGNHQSNIDMMIQANCHRHPTVCIAKKEAIWIPFFGLLFYFTGNIFIDRKNHEKAMEGMEEAKRYLTERKISIYMFPEGTRNKSSQDLLPFKKGAFHLAIAAQVPIVPVVTCRLSQFFDFKNRKIHKGAAQVEILEPIPTTGMTAQDVDTLLELTRNRMQEAFTRLSSQEINNH